MALTAGTRLGPYEILAPIGAGGMGEVYRAKDTKLRRDVALKVLPDSFASDPERMARFQREAEVLAALNHPNIAAIYGVEDRALVMELVEGPTLTERIGGQAMAIEEALPVARQIAEALEYAHEKGIIHRDLKPANVVLTTRGVKVLDFGLAKQSREGREMNHETQTMELTRAGAVLGTPRYMAPEQAESKPTDHCSDIYSLGVILYEMATGEAPFRGETPIEVMYQHVKQKPKDPRLVNPDLPEYFSKIVLKCLEKDPALRYQSAHDLLHDLESRTPPTSALRLIAETSFPKWLMAALAVVILLGIAMILRPVRDLLIGRSSVSITRKTPALVETGTFMALLPLRVIGNEPALKYEAEGLVDALSAKLLSLKNVHLAPHSEMEKLNIGDPLDKIASQLGVKLVLQGTVRGTGDRIDVQLSLDNADGHRRWTKEFTGIRQDLLTIEDQVYNELLSALELKPTNEELARSISRPTENVDAYELYLKGRNIMRGNSDKKRVQSALDLYEDATRKDSGFALAFAGLADASLEMYDLTNDTAWTQRALGAAQHAEMLNDELAEVHFALGNIYEATGKTSEAVVELKRGLSLAPNSDEGIRRLATAYLKAGQKDEALNTFQRAIDLNPYYWHNFNLLGIVYLQLGENQKALDAFRKVVELSPYVIAGYENIGAVYFQMGKVAESIGAFEKALKIAPSERLYTNLGTAYFYAGRLPEALKMFEKAVEMNPDDQVAQANLADGYRSSGQLETAKAAYDRAIALAYKNLKVNPRDASTLGFLAACYAKTGNSNRGLEFIRSARAIDPRDPQLMYMEGEVNAIAGRHADALKSLEEAFRQGYPPAMAKNDPELKSLSANPDFAKLLAEFSRSKTN
jgi:tetratricopeptide (TPR) repeat protein/predicted Ser/Thr protein kinase